ncbi:MAG TPA: MFS transporter [Actinomycetota bacterium]|nr:MFS transporter [Actinomycetota bacterium]
MRSRLLASLAKTFSSLRSSRNFRLYLTGQFVSAAGTWMNVTASSWLVLTLTGSGAALGVNAALSFGPVLLLGPWGGVLADRFDKRRILAATQSCFAVVSLSMAALVFTDVIAKQTMPGALWLVYGLSLAAGVITAIDNPARQSFYVEMVGEETLTNAVSLNSAAFTGARIVGPAIAGLLIAFAGTAVCFLIDGISYLAVLAALLAMHASELHAQKRSTRQKGHLVAGLKYVWATDELRRPLLIMAVIFTFVFEWQVLVPLLAEQTFHAGAKEFGLLSAAAGLGSFLGAIAMANRGPSPTMRRLALFLCGVGVSMAVVAFAPTLAVATLLLVPVGLTAMTFMITGNTMLQLTSRPEARGRVMALYGVVFLGSTPIGAPIVGVVAERIGAPATFFVSGLLALAVGGAVLARGWREDRIARRVVPVVAADAELAAEAADVELPLSARG